MLGGGKRNRILMMCTALGEKDTPQWPFWKWQHIKATRGVTDFAMLAVTREDSFIATIKDGVASTRALRRSLKTVDRRLLSAFLDEHYAGPSSWFVYGGHGVSDLLEFDSDHRMQVHELADTLGDRKFTGMLFDACLMSSLDTAYYLRNNTRYVGASEGYMWEEDTWAENHMFNPYSAALMARDGNGKRVLKLIGEEYTRKSSMADFTVIDTKYAAPLWNRVQTKHLASMHAQVKLRPEIASGAEPVLLEDYDDVDSKVGYAAVTNVDKVNTHMPASFPPARTKPGYLVPRDHTHRFNYEFPHSLFPAEQPDDHIVDLGCYVDADPDTQALLRKVVAWHDGPSNKSVYSPKSLSGLNFSFSQYTYAAARKAATAEEAVALGEQFELAQKALEDPVEPLRLTPRAKKSRKARKQQQPQQPLQKEQPSTASTIDQQHKVVAVSAAQASFHAVSAAAAPAPAATSVRKASVVSPVTQNRSSAGSPGVASAAGKAAATPASARAPTPPRS
jgi:hypothetical protein